MRKIFLIAIFALLGSMAMAQDKCFWVFFTDKNDTQFDPYSYFDAKAIARYNQCGADLYDISNYPLNDSYVNTVVSYSIEVFGESRWLNAIGVEATDDNAALIAQLPFVARVQEIVSAGAIASLRAERSNPEKQAISLDCFVVPPRNDEEILTDQLKRFGGQHFIDKGIDGKGMRICVMDGGFPKVNTHPAFQHLRDNHQIIKTYNFPNKKEDVYGWSTHGTMVLSCIAGINEEGQKLGLATGAEFLLARTEIDPEPFKEEVWWAQGAEWADKNGADIINSSLGYGKDRHWTKDMDGTSYVAKAANKAVEKGILICNSAGNEGDDSRWMTIITPADAENVICVGGIDANLDDYRHISFSSYGPTADKRRKPDVVAFGEAQVAKPSGGFTSAFGTSFASPLTAGFCACAWQTKRDLTALQMKAEILKSCDLYPYYDYAFGYGVPQAAYFTGDLKPAERSFNLVQEKDGVKIVVLKVIENQDVFINVEGADGVLLGYYKVHPDSTGIKLDNKDFGQGKKLNVSYNGFYDSCPISGMGGDINLLTQYRNSQNGTFKKVEAEGWQNSLYFQYDYNLPNATWNGFNRHFAFGRRWMYGKSYKIGMGLGLDWNRFVSNDKDSDFHPFHDQIMLRNMQLRGELLQRVAIRLWGINWDLGGYGGINITRRVRITDKTYITDDIGQHISDNDYSKKITTYYNAKIMNLFEYGAFTRISYSIQNMLNIGIYGSYRLSPVCKDTDDLIHPDGECYISPSHWSVGIELEVTP
ncbi:MAG: S8 family serine peptidase [Bacteroidales bacterium]|nr:S8 family serine peptidase [Bacteroidales bacterium]